MNTQFVAVNVIALILIATVLWWFFGSKPKMSLAQVEETLTVYVKDGAYQPSYIQIPKGKMTKLIFVRLDPTPCAGSVIISKLNAVYHLPLNQQVEVIIPPQESGELDFSCQMGMFRGKIIAM